jgi:antibiotic biosynthesis monooxygenase (ABM) superfamily enzyme
MTTNDQTATVVISHHIKEGHEGDYERWLDEIVPTSKAYPGHMGVQIIRPVPGASTKYTVIIRYDTRANLLAWMGSKERRQLIDKARPFLADNDRFYVSSGLDFWFTPEGAKAKLPTRWKQFLVTWSAIFPLVTGASLGVNWVVRRLGLGDNFYLRTLSVTCIVVLLMVYVVMPRYTKLVARWLFR